MLIADMRTGKIKRMGWDSREYDTYSMLRSRLERAVRLGQPKLAAIIRRKLRGG